MHARKPTIHSGHDSACLEGCMCHSGMYAHKVRLLRAHVTTFMSFRTLMKSTLLRLGSAHGK